MGVNNSLDRWFKTTISCMSHLLLFGKQKGRDSTKNMSFGVRSEFISRPCHMIPMILKIITFNWLHYVPDTMLSILYMKSHLIFTITLQDKYMICILIEKLMLAAVIYKAYGLARSVCVVFFSFCCIMIIFFFL